MSDLADGRARKNGICFQKSHQLVWIVYERLKVGIAHDEKHDLGVLEFWFRLLSTLMSFAGPL